MFDEEYAFRIPSKNLGINICKREKVTLFVLPKGFESPLPYQGLSPVSESLESKQ